MLGKVLLNEISKPQMLSQLAVLLRVYQGKGGLESSVSCEWSNGKL